MSKLHIIRSKKSNAKVGHFSYAKGAYIKLDVGFKTMPEFEKELLELLDKYYTVKDMNQTRNKRGRGSVGRCIRRGNKEK